MKQDNQMDKRHTEALRRVSNDADFLSYLSTELENLKDQLLVADRDEDIRSIQGMGRGYRKILSEIERSRT